MSASLVGSEMCIRDRSRDQARAPRRRPGGPLGPTRPGPGPPGPRPVQPVPAQCRPARRPGQRLA
eukprot:11977055-Alexandrium_andersonii.AAC.1